MKLKKSDKTGQWSVMFRTAAGKTVSKPLGTKSKAEAIELVKAAKIEELETAARVGALTRDAVTSIISGRNVKLVSVMDEYREFREAKAHSQNSIYSDETMLNAFIRHAGLNAAGIGDVTTKAINKYINNQDKSGLSHRKQRLTAIRGFMAYAIANAYILKDPTYGCAVDASKLSHGQKERRISPPFTEKDYLELRKMAPYFWRQAADFAWWTGLRLSDIACLEWESFTEDHLVVHTLKTDKRVALPYDDPLIGGGILRETISEIEEGDKTYCFPLQREIIKDKKRRATLSVYFKRVINRVWLNEIDRTFHSFRRSFVTRCKKSGKTLEDIGVWVGHSNAETTEKYNIEGSRL